MNVLIGTSGYDHPELKGIFYPDKLPRKDFLGFYATKFNALELNSTFYGMPTAERMVSFYQKSEGRLKFSIKMNRLLTHEIERNWQDQAILFKSALEPLLEKNALSTVLIQFPESFYYTVENRRYFAQLLKVLEPLPCVVEFRHKDWIRESVFEGLAQRNAGLVFCDVPQCAATYVNFLEVSQKTPFIGKQAYIRMHGRNQNGWYVKNSYGQENHRYDYEYSLEELKKFVPVIEMACNEGKLVQLYFNNHPKGTGFKNALELQQLLNSLSSTEASLNPTGER